MRGFAAGNSYKPIYWVVEFDSYTIYSCNEIYT